MVQRLCACKQHFLAARVCQVLGLSNAKVLKHWAFMKMALNKRLADQDLCRVICKVFRENHAAVSFATVARQVSHRISLAGLVLCVLGWVVVGGRWW